MFKEKMKSLYVQRAILITIAAFTTFITACSSELAPYPEKISSINVQHALSQKIMLDLRYYCADRKPNTNPDTEFCTTPMIKLPPELAEMITNSNLGGVILFADNLQNPTQIVQLTHDLQQAAKRSSSHIPLFISIDQEGGRVARLPRASSTSFSGNMAIGATYEKHYTKYASIVGDVIGKELAVTGFNVNHAPNVDVNINPDNPVINVRSFGESPAAVAQLGVAQLKAMQKHNVIGTLKHFPGHGDTNVDSHTGLPRVNHDLNQIREVDLAPFQFAIDQQQVDMIMTAHIQYPQLDNSTFVSKSGNIMMKPATMSKKILTGLLRKDMNYQGLIITDALDMNGISHFFSQTEAVIETFNAGADIALMPIKIRFKQDIKKLDLLLTALNQAVISGKLNTAETLKSFERIQTIKRKYNIQKRLPLAAQTKTALATLGSEQHRKLEQELSDKSITLLKGTAQLSKQVKRLHLLMPDKSKCESLTYALHIQKPSLTVTCSSLLSSDISHDMKQIQSADKVLAASITPKQTAVEMGGMDDIRALKAKYGYLASNKKRLDDKLDALLQYAHHKNKSIAFVSLRMPYDIKQYSQYAQTIIATYSYNQHLDTKTGYSTGPVYNSLAKLLSGKITATGSLPVSLKPKQVKH